MEINGIYPSVPENVNGEKKKREKLKLDRADFIFAAAVFIICIFGVAAGIWGGFRLGYTVSFCVMFAVFSAYLMRSKNNPGFFGTVCGILSLALTAVFTVGSNEVIRLFSVPVGAALATVWFLALSGKKISCGELGLPQFIASGLLKSVENLPLSMRSLFSSENKKVKGVSKVLLGVICAIPVLCAVIPLLIKSDAAFEGMVSSIFSDLATVAAQLILALVITPFCVSFAFSALKQPEGRDKPFSFKGLDTAFISAFLAVLGLVYSFYLTSQLAYFFDGFKGLLPEGYKYSYSEYARRGFFELCAVAAINLAILYLTIILSKKKDEKMPVILRALGTYISLFTILLICTATAKMVMYINNYGMTVLRVGTSAFMLFMGVVFIAMLLRLYSRKIKVLHTALVSAAVVLLLLGTVNINAVSAKYNYEAYVSGKLNDIDVEYLYQLGDEGIPYLIKICRGEDRKKSNQAANLLYYAYTNYYENTFDYERTVYYVFTEPLKKNCSKPSQFGITRNEAYKELDAFIAEYPDFLEKQGKITFNYDSEDYGYFEPEESTTAPPTK